MGRIKKSNITGAVGNLIFYEFRGTPVIRTKPRRVRQTKETKASASDFGLATTYSMYLRAGLKSVTRYANDRSFMYRMNTALLQWLGANKEENADPSKNIQALVGMELNEQAQFNRRIKLETTVDFNQPGKIIISIPAFTPKKDIKAPPRTHKIRLTVMVVYHNTGENEQTHRNAHPYFLEHLEYKYDHTMIEARQLEIPGDILAGDIVLAAIGIIHLEWVQGNELPVEDPKWANGKVVGVEYRV